MACLVGYNVYTVYSIKRGPGGVSDRRRHRVAPASVCVLIPVSSRGQAWERAEDSFVVRMALRNARNTTEAGLYNYTYYVGYDKGDAFFDNATTVGDLRRWFEAHVAGGARLRTVPIANPLQKPGPVMNALSRGAYEDGCEFMYRINDDTEFLTPWTSEFVRALGSFRPPNRGVVGPTCREGNTAILTHDFVHRGHLDLFGTHYPAELTDWWLDDWISSVYGPQSTLKLDSVVVRHHVLSTRYGVTWGNEALLAEALRQGRSKVLGGAGVGVY
jgi:hypothetical protein